MAFNLLNPAFVDKLSDILVEIRWSHGEHIERRLPSTRYRHHYSRTPKCLQVARRIDLTYGIDANGTNYRIPAPQAWSD